MKRNFTSRPSRLSNKRRIVSNSVSNQLPSKIDSFLQDFAQAYGGIDYNDIITFGKFASHNEVKQVADTVYSLRSDLQEVGMDAYEAAEAYDDIKEKCDSIVDAIKSIQSSQDADADVDVLSGTDISASDLLPEIIETEFSEMSEVEKRIIAKAKQSIDPQVYLVGAADAMELVGTNVTDAFINFYNRMMANWKFQ